MERRGVALRVELEREIAAGQHDRHPVLGDATGDEHTVARPHAVEAEHRAQVEQSDSRRRHVETVCGAALDDLRVSGRHGDTRVERCAPHRRDELAQLGEREPLLDDEAGGECERHRP